MRPPGFFFDDNQLGKSDKMLSSVRTLIRSQDGRIFPIGAVTGVLAVSLFVGGPGTVGLGTGYAYDTTACTSASIAAAPASPQVVGSAVVLTASATTCTHPEFQFYLQFPGGAWLGNGGYTPWNGTSTATFNWTANGIGPGTYGIGVWARNSGSTAPYEAYALSTYILVGNCTAVTITPSVASPQYPGTAVTFTASASGCPSPRFEWWAVLPGQSNWLLIQTYPLGGSFGLGSGNTYRWIAGQTASSAQGTYQIGVWARQGFTHVYDAYSIVTYTLSASCTTAAISASPASPQATGGVGFTATAAGCTGALFEFWWLPPVGLNTPETVGGVWNIALRYSTASNFSILADSAPRGVYQIGVWVKDPKSQNAYDSYAILTYYIGT